MIKKNVSLLLRPVKKLSLAKKVKQTTHLISTPARTRFAPSPTGFLHLGSLRTALYNYLLAKSTGGQFLLRLEDTDQKRLVQGAEENLYESLKWCGLQWDEGPIVGGPYGPYRQSDRSSVYKKYIDQLMDNGHAYRCFCSKERLNNLRDSAQKLQPPTTVSYDRNCAHLSSKESDDRAANGDSFTIRFKSPMKYPPFEDLLHGELHLQPQVNKDDIRYDDQVLVKSDGLPTYHFANVIDDHLMKITHVIRGEEWLPSTPKHIAMYDAFGWKAPSFIHIPLLTSSKDKKLSKRSGDINVSTFQKNGILPEALINFVALFGWAPKSDQVSEIYDLDHLIKLFNVNDLTKGNAKVDDKKLHFFNKHYLHQRIQRDDSEIMHMAYTIINKDHPSVSQDQCNKLVKHVQDHLNNIFDIKNYYYLISNVDFSNDQAQKFIDNHDDSFLKILDTFTKPNAFNDIDDTTSKLVNEGIPSKKVFQGLRYALAGGLPGLKIPLLIEFIGEEEAQRRVYQAIDKLKT